MPLDKALLNEFVALAPTVGLRAVNDRTGVYVMDAANDRYWIYPELPEHNSAPACYLMRRAAWEAGYEIRVEGLGCCAYSKRDAPGVFEGGADEYSETENHVICLIACAQHKQENPS